MAPPGRRRSYRNGSVLYLLTSILVSVFLASLPSIASAAGNGVVGIDLGTEYLKAALVKPGIPLEIVLGKDSKRKQTAAVAFKPTRNKTAEFPERFYGGDALSLAPRFPEDVYLNLKTLLGVPFDTGIQGADSANNPNAVAMYSERNPALEITESPGKRGTLGFKSQRLGEKQRQDAFLVEELLAMQLKEVKSNAELMAGAGSSIVDAVITYPPFYTAAEKRSVELAAELAGLNVVGLMSDGLAVGTNYATSRTFPSVSEGKAPEYHVIYDMGAGYTTASVLRFQSRNVKDIGKFNKTVQEVHVISTGWDRTLGGDTLNHRIIDDMVVKLIDSKKLPADTTAEQVKSHGKTMAKLWKESERIRQILSANSDSTASFETLYGEDVNFKYTLTRAAFERLVQGQAEGVSTPLKDALAGAKLSLGDVESVILHGGVIRTPFVQKQLESYCKDSNKIRTNVNADEAAVFGAAFKGAALSPSFKVKEIRTNDTPGYAVGMKWRSPEKERQQKMFTAQSEIGVEKQLTLKNLEDFELQFYQRFADDGKPIESLISRVQTTNLTASVTKLKDDFKCAPANITTQFSVRLSPVNALPEIVSGTVSCEVPSEKKGVVDDVKEFLGFGSKKSDQQPLKEEEEPAESINLDGSSQASSETSSTETSSSSTAPSHSADSDKPTEEKMTTETIQVAFTSSAVGPSPPNVDEMRRIKARLAAFDASDVAIVQRDEAFNNLESFIYRTRDLITDEEFVKAIAKDAFSKLEEKLSEADEWLQGDAVNAETPSIQAKLAGLKKLVDPVLTRQKENTLRPQRVEVLQQSLASARMLLGLIKTQKEEEALSAAQSESDAAAATESPSSASPSESASDDFASLEDNTSSTTTSETGSPGSKPTELASLYDPADIDAFSTAFDSVETWLNEQLAKQEGRSESEDAAFSSADVEAKAGELEKSLRKMMSKQKAKAKKGNTNGKKKTKGETQSQKDSTQSSTDKTDPSGKGEETVKHTAEEPEPSKEKHDEL